MGIIRKSPVRDKVSTTCAYCGRVFERFFCKTTRRFCSRKCSDEGRNPPIEIRFWSKVDKSGGPTACHPWIGALKGSAGYGSFSHKNKSVLAHRKAYELTYGPITEGMKVLHHCDNPPCCNPIHLFEGTTADNNADKVAKGRHPHGDTHYRHLHPEIAPRGEKHPMAKLTAAQVADIRERLANGERPVALAVEYGVTRNNIYYIRDKHTWRAA